MSLKLYPYNPDQIRERAELAIRLISESNISMVSSPILIDDDDIERQRKARRKWYLNGGKEICAKNGRDRRERLRRAGLL